MSEVFVWPEGSAYIYTGAGAQSALASYAQDVQLTLSRTWHKYRPPRATTYTKYVIAQEARLTIGQLYSQKELLFMFESATGGMHVHLKHLIGSVGTTAGFRLYSGEFNVLSFNGRSDSPFSVSVEGTFNHWSVY
ncbi:hypothetical protein LCGC14_3066190 [marine sediment metagenome]|uniref:Uncharacterized protein n=1 Tax=marine sediment metagenome TaxID=412755 RepID=A0A0F8Z832_9ZZZZ